MGLIKTQTMMLRTQNLINNLEKRNSPTLRETLKRAENFQARLEQRVDNTIQSSFKYFA